MPPFSLHSRLLSVIALAMMFCSSVTKAEELKVGILFSEESQNNYYEKFSYSQLFMAAQHQCTMAGIPFDLLDDSILENDSNLAGYDLLIIPHFSHVQGSMRNTYITELTQASQNGLHIISTDWLMGFNQNNDEFSDSGKANADIIGVQWSDFNGPVSANLRATNASHPALQGYAQNETILTYAQIWTDEFTTTHLAEPSGSNAYCTLRIDGQNYNAVNAVTTTHGTRNVHFTNAQIMFDSNLLWSAIHWSLYGTQPPLALRTGRQSGLFFARNDMDQSMFPYEVATVEFPLLDIITEWKTDYNFVGSYYLNVGNRPDLGEWTDWAVSGPLYEDYISLGNEIGTHSYTHPDYIKNLNASQLEFEFKDSKDTISANLSTTVVGAAVPGNAETLTEIETISQWLPYLSGRSAVTDSNYGLTTAYGYTRPGMPMFYNCLNTSPDFTLVGFLGYTANQAAQIWQQEVDNLYAHSPLPVVHWLWHDYGPVETEPGFTRGMFDAMISHAASKGVEFITGEEFLQRNQAFAAASLDVSHPDANTVQAQIAGSNLGKFSLELEASETITSVDNWYAWDGHKVFVPSNGGTFTIRKNGPPSDATRITALPARSELISLSGDGRNLNFSFRGQGKVTVSVPTGAGFMVVGADSCEVNGSNWDLFVNSDGLHSISVIPNTPGASFVEGTSTDLTGDIFTLGFKSDPHLTNWLLLGSPDLASGFNNDHTSQATITESPIGSGEYTATINVSTLGPAYFFRVGMEGLAVP